RARFRDEPGLYSDLGFAGADTVLDAFGEAHGDPDRFVVLARAVDVPDGGTIMGYGTRFGSGGENERAMPLVMRHGEGGALPVVFPARLATVPLRWDRSAEP